MFYARSLLPSDLLMESGEARGQFFSTGEPPLQAGCSLKGSWASNAAFAPEMATQQPISLVPRKLEDGVGPVPAIRLTMEGARPMVRFDSLSGFLKSLWARFASIWTKRFVLSLLAGQLVSLCVTCTDVTTTELVSRGWALPTTQTLFL
jgi:hypothetical protein